MKEESCRRCGKELEISKKCNVCNEPNQFHCHVCGYESEKQIHSKCLLVDFNSKLLN